LVISGLGALFLWLTQGPLHVDPTPLTVLLPALMGFFGCQVDSVLGATLEGGGLFTKEETNLLSITAGAALGFALSLLLLQG
ncbi:MAG TPA: hypothetical protein VNX21_08975, partial [Candidatus Thermoplasmatota archaeon]|nr:hypothetical protein [Candidatus Thermoplasmatota archaeon]